VTTHSEVIQIRSYTSVIPW